MFRAISLDRLGLDGAAYRDRHFLIVDGGGVLVRESITPSEYAMLQGLAEVVQRIDSLAPIHYLTAAEIACSLGAAADRYREPAHTPSA